MKIQFFKSFILPYIGYCSTLIINFPNYVIQKLHTFYYTCNLRTTDRFIVPKMNNHFGDATFINLANDLITVFTQYASLEVKSSVQALVFSKVSIISF